MRRRDFLGLAAIVLGCASGHQRTTLDPLAEFSTLYGHRYEGVSDTITILYPGSGTDLSTLDIAVALLGRTNVRKVNLIHTEIGDYESNLPTWHEGFNDLKERLAKNLDEVVKKGVLVRGREEINTTHPWVRKDISSSAVLEYELESLQDPNKKIVLSIGYNTFEQRSEVTEEEKRKFSSHLLKKAREAYWPKETQPDKIYPTYFKQGQLDEADIIISKQCGDFSLLQFDYVRGLTNTKTRKRRVVLTEHADRLDVVRESLGDYNTRVEILSNNNYGYCTLSEDCRVGILHIEPK